MAIFDGDRDRLKAYIGQLADAMGLQGWELNLMDEPPSNVSMAASIGVIYGRKAAHIHVQREWMNETPETFRAAICHELLHCYLNPSRNCIDNIESSIGELLYRVTWNALTDYIEYATDGIATAWAKTLPLPTPEPVEADGEIEEAA